MNLKTFFQTECYRQVVYGKRDSSFKVKQVLFKHWISFSSYEDMYVVWIQTPWISVLYVLQNSPLLDINNVSLRDIRDLFHVYLNKFEFHFLRLHINKTSQFCFLMNNGCVPAMA